MAAMWSASTACRNPNENARRPGEMNLEAHGDEAQLNETGRVGQNEHGDGGARSAACSDCEHVSL